MVRLLHEACLTGGLTVALVAVAALPCLARDLYLTPDGDDHAAGTREAPWETIANANASVQPGDTVRFLPGEYMGTISPAQSGTAEQPIILRSEERHAAVLTGGGDAKVAVSLKSRSHVAIEGFRIRPDGGRWVQANECDHLTIRYCHMEKSGGSTPFSTTWCTDLRLIDNTFSKDNVGGNMCDVLWCTRAVLKGNSFTRVGHCPLRIENCKAVVVRANCFQNCWGRNYEFVAFDNNHTPLNSTSYVPVTSRVREPFRLVNTRIYHNTIVENLGYGWEFNGMNISGNVFANNLLYRNDKYGGGVQIRIHEGCAKDNQFLNNLLRGPEPGQHTVFNGDARWTAEEANRGTPNYRDKWSQFEGNFEAEPTFVDGDGHDFRLAEGSAGINAGRPLTRTMKAGEGRRLLVEDAGYFYDGYGIDGEQGDWIAVGRGSNVARIVGIEENYYQPDAITLDRDLKWEANAPVSLPWTGEAPDVGAFETGAAVSVPLGLIRPIRPIGPTDPLLHVNFEPEDVLDWGYRFKFYRGGRYTEHEFVNGGAKGHCVRLRATANGSDLSCSLAPGEWNIDKHPLIRFAYRIPEGTPVGLYLQAFPAEQWGEGIVLVGGTPFCDAGPYPSTGTYTLTDDGQWHETTLDARTIREKVDGVTHLRRFRFYTHRNAKKGQEFWFDEFSISPA